MNDTLVFDMHGIIYSHNENFNLDESDKVYEEILNKHVEKNFLKKEIKTLKDVGSKTEQKLEYDFIEKAIKSNNKKGLATFYNLNILRFIWDNYIKNNKIVIVSNSSIDTQKLILISFLRFKLFIKKDKVMEMIKYTDFYNSSEYGKKDNFETWYKILKPYENITVLYEDVEENMKAAAVAVNRLNHTKCEFHMKV